MCVHANAVAQLHAMLPLGVPVVAAATAAAVSSRDLGLAANQPLQPLQAHGMEDTTGLVLPLLTSWNEQPPSRNSAPSMLSCMGSSSDFGGGDTSRASHIVLFAPDAHARPRRGPLSQPAFIPVPPSAPLTSNSNLNPRRQGQKQVSTGPQMLASVPPLQCPPAAQQRHTPTCKHTCSVLGGSAHRGSLCACPLLAPSSLCGHALQRPLGHPPRTGLVCVCLGHQACYQRPASPKLLLPPGLPPQESSSELSGSHQPWNPPHACDPPSPRAHALPAVPHALHGSAAIRHGPPASRRSSVSSAVTSTEGSLHGRPGPPASSPGHARHAQSGPHLPFTPSKATSTHSPRRSVHPAPPPNRKLQDTNSSIAPNVPENGSQQEQLLMQAREEPLALTLLLHQHSKHPTHEPSLGSSSSNSSSSPLQSSQRHSRSAMPNPGAPSLHQISYIMHQRHQEQHRRRLVPASSTPTNLAPLLRNPGGFLEKDLM